MILSSYSPIPARHSLSSRRLDERSPVSFYILSQNASQIEEWSGSVFYTASRVSPEKSRRRLAHAVRRQTRACHRHCASPTGYALPDLWAGVIYLTIQ